VIDMTNAKVRKIKEYVRSGQKIANEGGCTVGHYFWDLIFK